MDKVLKRVGLSKRCSSESKTQQAAPEADENVCNVRRRRRSKSRRRVNKDTKKSKGLFNIDWESVRDCKSCKSRAITRRLCSKRCDNELYRSNSFKFERFVREAEEITTLGKKISLCDDYSLPVDHLSKKRPNSFPVPSLSEWNIFTPNEETVEVLETYSTPRDSRQQLSQSEEVEPKCYTSPDREYSQPYTTEGSSSPSSDEEFFGHISIQKPLELNSPDSIAEAILPLLNLQSPERSDVKRHPSPYYYADLYKENSDDSPLKTGPNKYRKVNPVEKRDSDTKNKNLSAPPTNSQGKIATRNQNYDNQRKQLKLQNKSLSLDTPTIKKCGRHLSSGHLKYRKSCSLDHDTNIREEQEQLSNNERNPSMPINIVTPPCVCFTPEDGVDDEMSRQRHVYETAFDCRVAKSDDDLDQLDKVTNHPVLVQFNSNKSSKTGTVAEMTDPSPNGSRQPDAFNEGCGKSETEENCSISTLSQTFEDMCINAVENMSKPNCNLSLPLRIFTPSPPSTAPLPTKFHYKDFLMNSIRSAPNLPMNKKMRIKDIRLPIKSLRGRMASTSAASLQSSSILDFDISEKNELLMKLKDRLGLSKDGLAKTDKGKITEIKDRPQKGGMTKKSKMNSKDALMEFKNRRRRHKYSSTESMTTSSSDGSMESIQSSTSEGNRSTTSSESRHSASLSSHSSDSGGGSAYHLPQTSGFLAHANKLHILSPISDKSSQEPVSETSDNNRNNNSQKCSPEENQVLPIENIKLKRRMPQNKNLLNISFKPGDSEIQGSDSGISVQSRECVKPRFGLLSAPSQQDFSDLPFDMPKLRRRRIPQFSTSHDVCTSGSATSIDLRDLPFDMPKLRRRLRVTQPELCVSQASSSQSVIETDRPVLFQPKLTLNLMGGNTRQRSGLAANVAGLGLQLNFAGSGFSADSIDIGLPLEKQGWYHGAITRVEAETVLRLLQEGSFLVRNSESARRDYSLSLKSARGFMHMRIQQNRVDGSFILGQFSKPFQTIPEMIRHFSLNRLPIRGAEHMCLIQPVIAQLL